MHPGCFELFAHEPIRTIMISGKKVGIDALGAGKHIYVAIMAARVGSTPNRTSNGSRSLPPMELFAEGKVDAFLGIPPSRRSCAPASSVA